MIELSKGTCKVVENYITQAQKICKKQKLEPTSKNITMVMSWLLNFETLKITSERALSSYEATANPDGLSRPNLKRECDDE